MAFFAGMPLLVIVQFFLAFVSLLGLISVTAWAVRRLGGGRRSPRLAVIDYANVDRRRRLILVRRDNVEHLVMIGGPTDIVVESNFVRRASAVPRAPLPPPEGVTANRLAPANQPTSVDRVEAALNALSALVQ
jgi:flagellar protein FliO/FliZ